MAHLGELFQVISDNYKRECMKIYKGIVSTYLNDVVHEAAPKAALMPVSAFTWEDDPDAENVTVCNGFDCWFADPGESGLSFLLWPLQLLFFPFYLAYVTIEYIFTGFFPDLFWSI